MIISVTAGGPEERAELCEDSLVETSVDDVSNEGRDGRFELAIAVSALIFTDSEEAAFLVSSAFGILVNMRACGRGSGGA